MTNQKIETFIHESSGFRYKEVELEYVISGDTDSVYLDISDIFGRDSDKNSVIEFSDELGSSVNDSFDFMLGNVFNVPSDKREIIQTDREVVSDKSVFFGKKKYVMHIVNLEGKDVDKLKLMGVEIIKSDTPIVIQDFLREVVNMMLDDCTYSEIKKFISEFKSEYYKMNMIQIGRPTNIKVLNSYYTQYNNNLKRMKKTNNIHGIEIIDGNPFKGIPYHAKAAIVYNSMCTDRDIKIRSGDKMRIIYVRGEEYPAIGIPSDLEYTQLPKFLSSVEIDYDTMWEKVMNKLDLYLKPIGYDEKSMKQKQTNIFFFGENQ